MTIGEIMQNWSMIGSTLVSGFFIGFVAGLIIMAWLDDYEENKLLKHERRIKWT